MKNLKLKPVKDESRLQERLSRYFESLSPKGKKYDRLIPLDISSNSPIQENLFNSSEFDGGLEYISRDIVEIMNTISSAIPSGDLYLFGGLIRDIALFGRRGFSSDIDVVVDDNWKLISGFVEGLGANKNKFGGYRFKVHTYDIDIWNAKDTWAIRNNVVEYGGVESLLDTTILNWDAILMKWESKRFIHKENYFKNLNERYLDIVLEDNPNPLGMFVRIMRHLLHKDAQKISYRTIDYLYRAAEKFTFNNVHESERKSYGHCLIDGYTYACFRDRNIPLSSFKDDIAFIGDTISSRQFRSI